MLQKKVIVISYGSAGKRHVQNILKLGWLPYVVTRYPDLRVKARFFPSISEIKNINCFEYAVVASPTGSHFEDAIQLINSGVKNILIEKPLERSRMLGRRALSMAKKKGVRLSVAYNMRYLEAFVFIKKFVDENQKNIKIIEVLAGQYLPDWNPQRNYSKSYRAHRRVGGGVDLDLSHEVDYILWLFGGFYKHKVIFRKKISGLEIKAPDVCKIVLDYGKKIVDITLDCIRRPMERHLKILCENGGSINHNFVTNSLLTSTGKKILFKDNMDVSYRRMMKDFLGIECKRPNVMCTGMEALNVLRVLGT